jgi:predicted RNase H-like HicB family nuclease
LAAALNVNSAELVQFVSDIKLPAHTERGTYEPFTAVYQRDGEWWLGYVEEISGANAQERSLEECRESLREAVDLVLEANRELTKQEFEGDVVREPIGA